jgi:hypothetical protein
MLAGDQGVPPGFLDRYPTQAKTEPPASCAARMPDVGDRGVKLVAWLAAVGAVSGALAALLLSRATTPLSGNPWFVFCVVIAAISFAILLVIGPIAGFRWWRESQRRRENRSLAEVVPPVDVSVIPEIDGGPAEAGSGERRATQRSRLSCGPR